MPLRLVEAPSPAPCIQEVLSITLRDHIAFRRRDSFRIVVPDAEGRQDLERTLLEQEPLDGVLIGKSLLTLNAFAQGLLLEHPAPRPLASPSLQRKALALALETHRPDWKLEPQALQRCLRELQEQRRAAELRTGRGHSAALELEVQWKALVGDAGYWLQDQAFSAAWQYLAQNGSLELEGVQACFFLGFRLPETVLLDAVQALVRRYPAMQVHLYLPPLNVTEDGEDRYGPWRRRLESLAETWEHFPAPPPPQLVIQPHATPSHEVRALLHRLHHGAETPRILAPAFSPVGALLEAELRALAPEYAATPLAAVETQLPARLRAAWQKLPELDSQKLFSQLLEFLGPIFLDLQRRLAEAGDADSLRVLEAYRQGCLETARAERWRPRTRSAREWFAELEQDWVELRLPPPPPLARFPLRRLDRPGLEPREVMILCGMNDGVFPPAASPPFFDEAGVDFLRIHDANLALRQALGLARREAVLGFSQFSTAARALLPSPLLDALPGARWAEPDSLLTLSPASHHPYAEENIARERHRGAAPLGFDAGALQALELRSSVLEKLRRHPLSAKYLDDYAKCPWRFFARWHLGLEEEPEEDLEIAPTRRGRLLHKLLELTFQSLREDFFRHRKTPALTQSRSALETAFVQLSQEALQAESPVPLVLRRDQLERLRANAAALLDEEQETWDEAPQRLFPEHLEWRFGMGGRPGLVIPLEQGLEISLSGAVDRIDRSESNRFVLYDYKSSGGAILARELREGLNLQLWIYLQAVRRLLLPQAEPLGALYWDLKETKRDQGMARREAYAPYTHRKLHARAASFLKEEEFSALEEKLDARVREILFGILAGDYSLQPAACLGERCEFFEICRYEDKAR